MTINNPSLLKAEKAKVAELKAKWQSPYLHPELREELQDAYKKADLEGWQATEAQAKQKAADRPAEEGLPLFGENNFSVIGEHAVTFDKYVQEGRTFVGRDDGKLRAELDTSRYKFNLDKKNTSEISDNELHAMAQKAIVDALAAMENKKYTGLKEARKKLKNEIDKTLFDVYSDVDEILNYYFSYDSFNAEEAMLMQRKRWLL